MTVPWSLLWILGLICSSDSSCSPTSYYKSCWIRRYPGLYVDIEESQRRGAHILKLYQEESALKCSRACCLTRNCVDPDLLVFGKYFTTNVRVLPHMSSSRLNVSEPLTSDKRQFNYPPNPPVRSISPASTTTKKPTTPQATHAVPTAHEVQHNLPRSFGFTDYKLFGDDFSKHYAVFKFLNNPTAFGITNFSSTDYKLFGNNF
ncbi:MANSC domain-containing 4 [Labeo rohita]|uniref:MANSC domain-containing 4 n=1 Tax=Labeo rohita TaxID=84645 RepID=A0A498NSM1_LABRO|nr:MANSC domain-containing 4 [Labeo rohita]